MSDILPEIQHQEIPPPADGDLLSLSIPRILWKVALPATLSFMLNMVFGLIDAFWVGKLGAGAMAALSSASIITWILYSLGSIGAVGTQSLVSQATGAKTPAVSRRVIIAAMGVHIVLGVICLLPLYFLSPTIFSAMGLTSAVSLDASGYLNPFMLGMSVYFVGMIAMSAFHATGDAKTPAIILAGSLLVNAVLDPFFILGWGPFPAWGLFGAGFATMIAKFVFTGWILWKLHQRNLLSLKHPGPFHSLLKIARRVAGIGFPIAINGAVFASVYLILIRILAVYGTAPVAALGIVHRIEGVAWFACVGFSVAAAAIAGQHLGNNDPDKSAAAVWHINWYLSAMLAVISLGFMIFGEAIMGVFIKDADVITQGADYLFIIAIFEILLGWEVIFSESLGAVGASRVAFWIATPLTLIRIPLAWLFAIVLGYGINAVWWAIAISTGLKGLALAIGFTKGAWRSRGSLVDDLQS